MDTQCGVLFLLFWHRGVLCFGRSVAARSASPRQRGRFGRGVACCSRGRRRAANFLIALQNPVQVRNCAEKYRDTRVVSFLFWTEGLALWRVAPDNPSVILGKPRMPPPLTQGRLYGSPGRRPLRCARSRRRDRRPLRVGSRTEVGEGLGPPVLR